MKHARFVTVALLILFFSVGCQTQTAQEAIKIGAQLPLSGERAPVGQLIKQGVEMAVEHVNGEGGVNGVPVVVVFEDDRDTKKGAIEAARKLVQDDQVAAIIGELFSPYVLASRPLVERDGVPFLTGGTNPRTTEETSWIFRVGASDTLLADVIARYAVEDLNARRLAVLHDRSGIHNKRAERVIKVLRTKYGIVPAVTAAWKPGDTDFSSQLQQVKASPAKAIITLGETAEGGPFLKQTKALGIQGVVIAHRDFGAKSVLQEAGEAAEGVLIITEYIPALQEPNRQAWAKAYKERFGTEANVIAAQYYDALLLLAEAVKRAGPSREEIKAGLKQLKDFEGVMADYTFDENNNGVHRFYVVKIKQGKPTLEKTLP